MKKLWNLFAYFKTNRALIRELQLTRKELIDITVELGARKTEIERLKTKGALPNNQR
jgi:hypothetical protein